MTFELHDADIGDICLTLENNKAFHLDIKIELLAELAIMGDIDHDDFEPFTRSYHGNWNLAGQKVVLTFDNIADDDLRSIFISQFDNSRSTTVVNDNTVTFDRSAQILNIRGIYCERKEGDQ